jgi:hypothetical protein
MTSEIKFSLHTVTPEMAAEWLKKNEGNRALSRMEVNHLKTALTKCEWRLVHQAIAFDSSGNLIDGQHRLTAIAETGIPARLYVARYADLATAKGMPFDVGKKRTAAQILQESAKATQIITTLFYCWTVDRSAKRLSIEGLGRAVKLHEQHITAINEAAKANDKNPAAIRAGVLLAMLDTAMHLNGSVDDIIAQFAAFAHSNYDIMWPSVRSLNKQWETKTINGGSAVTLGGGSAQSHRTARAYIAFCPANQSLQSLRCADPRQVVRDAVDRIGKDLVFPQ